MTNPDSANPNHADNRPSAETTTDNGAVDNNNDLNKSELTELEFIRQELQTLNRHRFVKVQNSLPRMLLQSFLRGIAVGFGSVLGASIVVSVVISVIISLLTQIEFIPIIGEWAKELMTEIQQHQEPP